MRLRRSCGWRRAGTWDLPTTKKNDWVAVPTSNELHLRVVETGQRFPQYIDFLPRRFLGGIVPNVLSDGIQWWVSANKVLGFENGVLPYSIQQERCFSDDGVRE